MFEKFLGKVYRKISPHSTSLQHPEFGGSGITEDCYNWIRLNIKNGSSVLEFGAGLVSTPKLSEHYKLTSVEHNEKFIGAFKSHYLYAPLSLNDGWYELDKLRELNDKEFDLTIIDGPPGSGNRFGILLNLHLLEKSKRILVDDTNRPSEKLLLELLSRALNRPYSSFESFSVIENYQ
jgi:hypothetical protein